MHKAGVDEDGFWSAAAEGRLVVDRCARCGTDSFPPSGLCADCGGRVMTPVEVTSRGRIYSFTVNHQQWLPDLEVPCVIVLVEFPDHPGVRVVGLLRGCEPENVSIGAEVVVGFAPGPAGVAVPEFTPVDAIPSSGALVEERHDLRRA
jgi:uncharacterized protein